jgi:hypothetical protein
MNNMKTDNSLISKDSNKSNIPGEDIESVILNNFRNSDINPIKLDDISVKNLKKICKKLKISGYSKLKKNQLVVEINTYFSVIKIQKFFRLKNGSGELCPISMDKISYPCFPFKPKGHSLFIYYNLEPLVSYLLTTGDFRDPKTREKYSPETLQKMDKLRESNKIKGKSVFRAFKNKRYYKKKNDIEENITVIERCLDDIISSMRSLLENRDRRRRHAVPTLNTLFFMSFRVYFRRLVAQSRDHAENLIQRTIKLVNETVNRPRRLGSFENISDAVSTEEVPNDISDAVSTEEVPNDNLEEEHVFDEETSMLRDTIIQFLFQVRFDELTDYDYGDN